MKKEYTAEETATYKAERRAKTRAFKAAMNGRGKTVQIEYPESATNQQRGFTPAGSARLHFDAMRRTGPRPSKSLFPQNSNRKPTAGSKYIPQVITHKKGELLTKILHVPEAKNKRGEVIRKAFSYQVPEPKFLHHERRPGNVKPLSDKIEA